MPTKEELYEKIDSEAQTHYSKGQVKYIITSVSNYRPQPPKYFKKGDIIANSVGSKKRPCVVIKIEKDFVYALAISTTKDELNLCKSRSRFLEEGFFSKGLVVISKDKALEDFIGVYDNPKLLNKAIKLMKQEVAKL